MSLTFKIMDLFSLLTLVLILIFAFFCIDYVLAEKKELRGQIVKIETSKSRNELDTIYFVEVDGIVYEVLPNNIGCMIHKHLGTNAKFMAYRGKFTGINYINIVSK